MSGSINIARQRFGATACRLSPRVVRTFTTTSSTSRQNPGSKENYIPVNDPNPGKEVPTVSKTNELAVDNMGVGDNPLQENVQDAEKRRVMQAPNRKDVWSRNQMPREMAMSGPRFEQTIMEVQPRPYAAIDLIHKQPVRWVSQRAVACDGGGGPLGHPKIFINCDKPQINFCTYCGLPYAKRDHEKYLRSLPKEQLSYPLDPNPNDPDQIAMPNTPSQKGAIQGQYPILKGELNAENESQEAFSQR